MAPAFLLIIGHREGLSWVLKTQRMAFVESQRSVPRSLAPDDQLFLYTTRGCFLNPTRSIGQVIGKATITGTVAAMSPPVEVGGRRYPFGCPIHVDSLAPLGQGVPLQPLLNELDAFSKNPGAWSAWLRRTMLPLSDHDATVLANHLTAVAQPPESVIAPYLKWLPADPQGTPATA
jgi:hypothetical protein